MRKLDDDWREALWQYGQVMVCILIGMAIVAVLGLSIAAVFVLVVKLLWALLP